MPINATITPPSTIRTKVTPQNKLLVTQFRQNINDFSLGDLINVNVVPAYNGSLISYNSNTTNWEISSNIRLIDNALTSVNVDQDIVLLPNGNGSIDVSGSRITNIGTPVANTDAVPYALMLSTVASASMDFSGNIGTDTLEFAIDTLSITGNNGITSTVSNNSILLDLDDTGIVAGDYGDPDAVATLSVDAKGRVTGIANMAIAIDSSQVNDFVEAAQDAIGDMLIGSQTGMLVTYDDANNALEFSTNPFTISISGVVSGNGTVTDLANVSITTVLAPGSVVLGTDTSGAYVVSLVQGTGVSITGTSTPTISIGQDVSPSANVSFNNVTADLLGNANTANTAAILQTARNIILTGDATGTASFNGSANADITVSITTIDGGTY